MSFDLPFDTIRFSILPGTVNQADKRQLDGIGVKISRSEQPYRGADYFLKL